MKGGQLDRWEWRFESLVKAEKEFDRRLKKKKNLEQKSPREVCRKRAGSPTNELNSQSVFFRQPNYQHRLCGPPQHPPRRTPYHGIRQGSVSVGAHHDQIAVFIFRIL